MKFKFNFFLAAFLPALLLINGCQTGELNTQVLTLSQQQNKLTTERDSLVRIIVSKSTELDAKNKDVDELAAGKAVLETKNKSLQSSEYSRDKQLKTVTQQIAAKDSTIASENLKNDSLMKEIALLEQKIQQIDTAVAEEQRENLALTQSLKVQEDSTASLAMILKEQQDSLSSAKLLRELESGFVNILEIGGGFGLGDTEPDYSRSLVSLNNVFGYNINKHWTTGIGTGVNFYNGGVLVPLYADIRYKFNAKKVTPFIFADAGLLMKFDDFLQSSLFINPQIGLMKRLNDKVSFHIATGVLVQQAPGEGRNTFINLKGGVSFRGK